MSNPYVIFFTEVHKMSKKIQQMLTDLVSLHEAAKNLSVLYTNTMDSISLTEKDVSNPHYHREYLSATRDRLNAHNQQLTLERFGLDQRVNNYLLNGATINDHMGIICLGEDIAQWTDRYKAIIIESCFNVNIHIEAAINANKLATN